MDNGGVSLVFIEAANMIVFLFKDDEDADDAEEESEGGEQDDEMDAQQGPGSPSNNGANTTGGLVAHDA